MGGADLARAIRRLPACADTKLVLASSAGIGCSAACAMGFDTCLGKPVHPSSLFRVLASICGIELPPDDAEAEPMRSAADVPPLDGAKSLRILVAEDNRINQMLVAALLQKLGHRVGLASNGIEAVDAVRSIPYDLVLMDVSMPEMDGLEATRRIRSLDSAMAGLPIIAITANAMKGDRAVCLEAGMNDYVAKPIDRDRLIDAIAAHTGVQAGVAVASQATLAPVESEDEAAIEPAASDAIAALLRSLDEFEVELDGTNF
jgi:CheY-like chemotaxis protein